MLVPKKKLHEGFIIAPTLVGKLMIAALRGTVMASYCRQQTPVAIHLMEHKFSPNALIFFPSQFTTSILGSLTMATPSVHAGQFPTLFAI